MTRRGFFFTIMALVLVSFIFVSIQLWVQAQSAEEARMAERFRIEALHTALGIVSNETLAKFVNASAMYAVNRLGAAIEDHPDCRVRGIEYYTGPGSTFPDGTFYLNTSIYELMLHGDTSGYLYETDLSSGYGGPRIDSAGRYFYDRSAPQSNLTYVGDDRKYSLDAFFNRTRAAVRLLGYDVSWGEAENFTFNQTDAWTLQVNMTVAMNFTDSRGWVNITKRMPIVISIPIDGFSDPSILRADMSHRPADGVSVAAASCGRLCGVPLSSMDINQRPHHNVYRALDAAGNPTVYNDRVQAQAKLLRGGAAANAWEGLGWFFGPVTTDPMGPLWTKNSVVRNLSRIRSYIFMTDSPDEARTQSRYFGGIILKDKAPTQPKWSQTTWVETRGGRSCEYTNHTQDDCLFCIRYQSSNDTPTNCPLLNPLILSTTIPDNPHIPWISVDGDPTFGVPLNYHLGLPEVLISNNINSTDLCGSTFDYANLACASPDQSTLPLEKKRGIYDSASKILDLSGPRDMAICGFYVRSAFSPSYSQRFTYFWPQYDTTSNLYSRLGQGIESFAVGKWAGGALDSCAQETAGKPDAIETHSRLDYQFYADDYYGSQNSFGCTGPFVKGMPGCKSLQDCYEPDWTNPPDSTPLTQGPGRFAFSHPDISQADRDVWPTYPLGYNVKDVTFIPSVNPGTSQCR